MVVRVGDDGGSGRRRRSSVVQLVADVPPQGLDLVEAGRLELDDLNESHFNHHAFA
jgi:hypothetical protein